MENKQQTSEGGGSAGSNDSPQDLALFVQTLLQQMQQKFEQMSDNIIGRIDEMGNRIDELEKSIADLMVQAGVDNSDASNPKK